MLTKETVIDKTEIAEDGSISVRRATYILEDGVRITEPSFSRVAYAPGESVAEEHARVKAIAAVVWTQDVLDAAREKANASRRP